MQYRNAKRYIITCHHKRTSGQRDSHPQTVWVATGVTATDMASTASVEGKPDLGEENKHTLD